MEGSRELRKFPRGERCPECGVRKWYLENGLRFCSNGHQVEGFIQFDVGDEADAGKLGAVARREKETKERELRHLSGQEGKKLFLESLQLILRNQLLWLIKEKGHRDELETVVRDLWDLRTRGSGTVADNDPAQEGALEMFSSQPTADEQVTPSQKPRSRAQSWDPERGPEWPMPRVLDTLVLCYLGCLLLRIPTRVGEICHWVNCGWMPYKRAYYGLPQEMRDRMPSAYTKSLKTSLRKNLRGSDLYDAIENMAVSYQLNYRLVFPSINAIPTLVGIAKELALPVEVLVSCKSLVSILHLSFELPIHKSRIFLLDQPEVLLLATFVVAAKISLPSLDRTSLFQSSLAINNSRFDWKSWKEGMDNYASEGHEPRKEPFEDATADQVTAMSDAELDKYFSYIASLIDRKNENAIVKFFPTEDVPPLKPTPPEMPEGEQESKLAQVLDHAMMNRDKQHQRDSTTTSFYQAYRSVSDLSENIRTLYEASGRLVGLSLAETVRVVYMLEQRMLAWQGEIRR